MPEEIKDLTAPPPPSPVGEALRTDMRPFRAPDFSKVRTSRDVLAEQSRIIPEVAQAEASFKEAEMAQQTMLAGEKARGLERVASNAKARIAKTQADEATFPYPEFHPTKENAQSLGELFSMMSTVGVMLGGAGKLSSLNALNAMGGMLKGWQAGRADLFKREKETFDKEFQRIKSIRENLRKDLDDYMKLLPYDKEAAMYKAEEITRKVGSNSIIAAYMAKQQPEMALKLLDSAGNIIQHKEDRDAQMQIAKMREARADERARLQREQQLELAKLKAYGAAAKVSEKTQKEIGENIVALKSLSDLSKMVDAIKDESGVFGAISGNVPLLAAQYYQSDAAKQTIAKLQEISAEKLKLLSGATVTVAEFARDRGFLPQRDDTPATIQSKITNLYDAIRTETETIGSLRKLDDVSKALESIPEPLYPSFRKAAVKPKGPAVGEIKNGYRFKGGDPSKPESWEKLESEASDG